MNQIAILGGHLIDPLNNINQITNIYLAQGHVIALGQAPDGFTPHRKIDATGKIICPGLIDLQARLREPGQEHKATIASETRTAAKSGITTVCCPPDTTPVIDTPAVAELIIHRAKQHGFGRVLPIGALTGKLAGEQINEMYALKSAGCVAVSNGERPISNTVIMQRAMEYASTHHLTVFLHAADEWLSQNGFMHRGEISTRLGIPATPESAETTIVARDLILIEQTGVTAHFCKITSAAALNMISQAQKKGIPVTADVTAHHLFLTETDVLGYNSNCHVSPPLRTWHDREMLRQGLAEGTLNAICSDHQPHEEDAKLAPFSQTASGISALETLLPLGIKLVEEKLLDLPTLIHRLTLGPAKILGSQLGHLSLNAEADICIFSLNEPWILNPKKMLSHGHNTPFSGWEFNVQVNYTLLAGQIVYEAESV